MAEAAASRPHVKICGLRTEEHAVVAARAGADFLGFVFVEGVRRQLQPEEGAGIVNEYVRSLGEAAVAGPQLVGLFRDQPRQWVRATAWRVGLDVVQLCGEEDLAFARGLGLPVLRQVRVMPGQSTDQVRDAVRRWTDAGHMVILDAFDPNTPGGAGVTFDWVQATDAVHTGRVLLAGGLRPENVRSAIDRLHPWGVDVSSGVESDGAKDAEKIQAFIRAAKSSP